MRLASSRTLLWLQQTNMAEARRRMLRLQNVEPRNQWGHHVWLHHYLHLYLSDHFLEYLLLLSSFHALSSYLLLSFSFILLSCPESIFSSSSCLYFTNRFIHAAWLSLSLSLSCTHASSPACFPSLMLDPPGVHAYITVTTTAVRLLLQQADLKSYTFTWTKQPHVNADGV